MSWRNSLHGHQVEYDDNFLYIRGKPVGPTGDFLTNGKLFFVDSTVDGEDGGSPDKAVGTLAEAIAKTVAARGDKIIVMPQHAETLTANPALDKASVSVIGIVNGSERASFTFDAAGRTISVGAAKVSIRGIRCIAGAADHTVGINITGGATRQDQAVIDVEFVDSGTNLNWLTPIKLAGTTNNGNDRFRVQSCRWMSPDAGCLEFLEVNADVRGLVVADNFVSTAGTASPLVLCATGKDIQQGLVLRNMITSAMTAGDLLIDNDTTDNSGVVAYNLVGHLDTAGEIISDADGMYYFQNYATAVVTASGYLLPAADA